MNIKKAYTIEKIIILFVSILPAYLFAIEEKGVPLIKNFSPQQYLNFGKVWDISSTPNGMVYFAADKGLLEFDGNNWRGFKAGKGIVRAVLSINDSTLISGSDLDFGIWKKNKFNQFNYTSLFPFKEDKNSASESFWDVHYYDNKYIFISLNYIYIYTNNQITTVKTLNTVSSTFLQNDTLFIADNGNKIYFLEGIALKEKITFETTQKIEVLGFYYQKGKTIFVTKKHGLFTTTNSKFLEPINSELSENLKISLTFCYSNKYTGNQTFGTVLSGLIISNVNGEIIHIINKRKGLGNNTVLSLHMTNNGKLWLGLDYGISMIDIENPFSFVQDFSGNFGTGQTAIYHQNSFYLGTNQGLYLGNKNSLFNNQNSFDFKLIKGSEGQVWTIKNINNTILVGHDKGIFEIENQTWKQISATPGCWDIIPYKNYLLTGHYNGIMVFKKSNTGIQFIKKMEWIEGSCNQLVMDEDENLWVSIPNYGIIKTNIKENLSPYKRKIYNYKLFETNDLILKKHKKEIHLFTQQHQFKYDAKTDSFKIIKELNIDKEIVTLIPNIERGILLDNNYEFYRAYNGFALKKINQLKSSKPIVYPLICKSIEGFNNDEKQLVYPGAILPYYLNNLRISVVIPHQSNAVYQYSINKQNIWHNIEQKNEFEILNLKQGKNTIYVKAFINNKEINEIQIPVYINAQWYRSKTAYLIYFVFVIFIIYILLVIQNSLMKKQKKAMLLKEQQSLREQAEKHRLEVIGLEQELLKTENQQIKQQLKNKTVELAGKAKDNEEKNKLLMTIKEKFDSIQKEPQQAKLRINEVKRLLESYINTSDKTFEIQIDDLHQEFFKKLKEKFPSLSHNDLRLCAYLKIGLNSKEISDIMNIQPSSAFINRSRLRKKLNLNPEEDLIDFLNKF